jgi:G protein-coupled receptor kinase interacting protein 2
LNCIFFRLSGHKDIEERLNDNLYEVLDVLSVYVYGRKAEHKNGEHMVNFDLNDDSILDSDQQDAIKKMQQVN